MKIFKIILFVIVLLIALILLVAAFLPSKIKVERSLVISSSTASISDKITNLRNWDEWSPWKDIDSTATYTYNDTVGTGGCMSWKGELLGKGKLSITKITGDSVVYSLSFVEPFESISTGSFSFSAEGESVRVTWSNIEDLSWPVGRILGFFMDFDEMMGPDFEKGLEKLKKASEYIYTYKIEEKEVTSVVIATIRNKVTYQEIPKAIESAYCEIQEYLKKNKAEIAGYPMAITYAWDSLSWDFEAALPINTEIKGNDRINIKNSYSGKVIFLTYTGPYEGTFNAYTELHNYIKEKGLTESGGPWEVYVTDPMTEPDQSKWVTEIYFPVK